MRPAPFVRLAECLWRRLYASQALSSDLLPRPSPRRIEKTDAALLGTLVLLLVASALSAPLRRIAKSLASR